MAVRRFSVVVLVAYAVAVACSPPTPSGSTSPPSTPSQAASGSIDAASGWERVELGGAVRANVLSDVIGLDGEWFVAGSGGDVGDESVVLRSANATDWTAERIPGRRTAPSAVAAAGDRLIAFGAGGAVEIGGVIRCAHPSAADLWVREPTGTWTEAHWADMFCATPYRPSIFSFAGLDHLMAVGEPGEVAVSWSSGDGLTWSDLHPNLGDFLPKVSVVDGDGIVTFGPGPDGEVASRRSRDGRTFVPAPFGHPGPDAGVLDAELVDGALDVFLVDGQVLGLAHREPAGDWSLAQAAGIRGDEVTSIRHTGDWFVALGADETGAGLAWTSRDGLSWVPLALPRAGPDTGYRALTVLDQTAVVVGGADSADGSRTVGAIWVGSTALLAPAI